MDDTRLREFESIKSDIVERLEDSAHKQYLNETSGY